MKTICYRCVDDVNQNQARQHGALLSCNVIATERESVGPIDGLLLDLDHQMCEASSIAAELLLIPIAAHGYDLDRIGATQLLRCGIRLFDTLDDALHYLEAVCIDGTAQLSPADEVMPLADSPLIPTFATDIFLGSPGVFGTMN